MSKSQPYSISIGPFAPPQWLLDDPKYQELAQSTKDGVLAFMAERERELLFGNPKPKDPQARGIFGIIDPKVKS